jgi:DNA modification methylase
MATEVGLWMLEAVDLTERPSRSLDAPRISRYERDKLLDQYRARISHNPALDRTLVSFQANKQAPFYSWFKYREGFSEQLVSYLLRRLHPEPRTLLDPFAGSGAALFSASDLGWQTTGIELLPVGVTVMQSRLAARRVNGAAFGKAAEELLFEDFTSQAEEASALRHIPITAGAFPPDEESELIGYIVACHRLIADDDIRTLLFFAAMCVLEDISYTRKDGQYLRWDGRSGRTRAKKALNKGYIPPFREAIRAKLRQMTADLSIESSQPRLFTDDADVSPVSYTPELLQGSSLDILPSLPPDSYDFVLTSPPYANRYDYTRTYALELVFLGRDAEEVKRLRQTMLSCTVENKEKREYLRRLYITLGRESDFTHVEEVFADCAALHEVLDALEIYRKHGALNNDNIVRLVRNYFYEMAFVIYEMARLLKPGGTIAMVNDNVRYAGEEVPVDLILSSMAESFELHVQHIWTLGRGKGNSSQQMGNHGRSELRKCVYIWQKR